jgi:hypothetical protein
MSPGRPVWAESREPGGSWLPPPRERDGERDVRPWRPPALDGVELAGLSYAVVEEILGDSVGLSVAPWPVVDRQGRLRFGGPAPVLRGTSRRALESFLADHRLPAASADRPLRIGDVFAVRAAVREPAADGPLDLAAVDPPVHDVTADAREQAKTSLYAAVAPTLDPLEAGRLEQADDDAAER